MNEDALDKVFQALAHSERRRMLDLIKAQPGCCVNDVAARFEMSRIGVMKHLKVLEVANLVLARKVGRERQLHFNAVPIQLIHERWTTEFSQFWASRLTQLKYKLEGELGDA